MWIADKYPGFYEPESIVQKTPKLPATIHGNQGSCQRQFNLLRVLFGESVEPMMKGEATPILFFRQENATGINESGVAVAGEIPNQDLPVFHHEIP